MDPATALEVLHETNKTEGHGGAGVRIDGDAANHHQSRLDHLNGKKIQGMQHQ
jgi:hypothetical protein